MTTPSHDVLAHEPEALVEALQHINAARADADGSDGTRRAYAGFQRLLEALPVDGAARTWDGTDAIAEIETLLAQQDAETGAEALHGFLGPILERLIEAMLDFPERRLAVYGSLLPNEANHHHVADLSGRWVDGTVRGTLYDRGWAAREGYPAMRVDAAGDDVPVGVLVSPDLPDAWERLDAFEGPGYRRVLVPVATDEGVMVANVYELAESSDADEADD